MSVICLGETLIDRLADNLGVAVADVKSWTDYPGGAPTNVACSLAKLGTPTTLISCLGMDEIGEYLVDLVTNIGVNPIELQRNTSAPTRFVYVTRSIDGDRQFAGFGDIDSQSFADAFLDGDLIAEDLFIGANFLVLGTISFAYPASRRASEIAIEFARKHGVKIAIDVNWRPMFWQSIESAKSSILAILTQVDIVKLSAEEAEWLFNTTTPATIATGLPQSRLILVTDGEKGCHYSFKNITGFIPAIAVTTVDTTGAGDCFVAATIHQLCQQSLDALDKIALDRIITYAAAAGAIATTKPGAIDSQPTHAEIIKLLGK
jgi:fructokinase